MERILRWPYIASVFLLVYMPFHVFLSQWLSTYTGQLDFWKIAKDLILFGAVLLSAGLVYIKRNFKDRLFWWFFGISGVYLLIHLLVWQFNTGISDKLAVLGTVYNCRLLGFAILGWATGILSKKYFGPRKAFQIAISVSTIICLIGILQMVLPQDFLSHFGYSEARGAKSYFFIDNKPELRRIMSTLREPNSLGAYLILPLTVLAGAWLRKPKDRILFSGLFGIHALALFLTFSRSAWAGAFLSILLMSIWVYKKKAVILVKRYWPVLIILLALFFVGIFSLRNQYFVQNALFHSDENTVSAQDSNDKHGRYLVDNLRAVSDKPLGHGPGTAGPVSIHSNNVVIPEDYFLQIAYEVGVMGLVVLMGAMLFLCRELYRTHNFYSNAILASFAGITFCNLVLHTWANEAVALQWWLLAGLCISGLGTVQKRT